MEGNEMRNTILKHGGATLALAAALSLGTVTAGSAAPRWGAGAAIGAGVAGFALGAAAATAASPYYYGYDGYYGPYDGYYDYAPGPVVAPQTYYGAPYWSVTPAFPPGCGAGKPHC
jgi:hypothetical protein